MTLFNEYLQKICAIFVILLLTEYISAKDLPNAAVSEPINEFIVDDIAKGVYSFRYKTPENIERKESGRLDSEGYLVVEGFYSYTDPDGKLQYVSYYADKGGYRTFKMPKLNELGLRMFDANVIGSLLG